MSYGATPQAAAVPGVAKTKIEPKVNLAAERTLLNTLRVALLLGTFSIALLNAAKHANHPLASKLVSLFYACFSVAAIVYGYRVFQTRRQRIANKWPGHFDELYGPMVLCVLLFAAILVNFIVQVNNRGNQIPTPKNPWLAAYVGQFVTFKETQPASST